MKSIFFSGRRKFFLGSVALLVAGLFYKVKVRAKDRPQNIKVSNRVIPTPNPRLGINLAGIADWNSEQPFVDFFTMSRQWVSQAGTGWGTGPALDLDAQGWVKALAPGCRATRFICSLDRQYPSGEYVILYDGEGDFKLTFPVGAIAKKEPGRMVVLVNANKGAFALDLVSTNPNNYLRNVRVIAPGFEKTYQDNPWHPNFLKRWSGVACVRFMDFMTTNNSPQMHWQDRPTLGQAGFSDKGVPVELMVDLANRLETDAWFCFPHQADDDYVQQFAGYVKKNLKPNLRAWYEYSNELWNGGFQQTHYAGEMGKKLKLADQPWEAGWKFTAHRSIEIFKLLDEVYAGQSNLVKVIGSLAANHFISEQILGFESAANYADVLAVAPYVSLNVSPQDDKGISEKSVASWNLDRLFEYLNKVAIPESSKWIEDCKKVANRFGLQLVAYEGGQHLVGVMGAENNKALTELLMDANTDKRMGQIYAKNFQAWEQAGGDLFCTFNSVSNWSKWGSWGLLRNNDENPKDSPKFSAVIQWAKSRGQKMNL